MALSERLPSLTALRAFDAAARHMSFARAADELFVTPAALSYQIKTLEQDLGLPLFRRLNRAVELTDAGRILAPGIARGFGEFRGAVQALTRATDTGLTITAGPAFTAKWLAPRIYRFVERRPDVEVRLVASLKRMDFVEDGVDAAIRFTRRDEEPGCYVETLINELMTPVCSPEWAAKMSSPADLAHVPLLHDNSLSFMERPPTWADWLKCADVDMDWRRGAQFSHADHVLDAAAGGGGVALGRLSMAKQDLTAGRLVAPFDMAIDTGAHFNFVCPEGAEDRPDIAAFLEWLRAELADESAPEAGMKIVTLS
ncbi:MAG: transcriptional regulator GcvA [Pikeienuella sp.]